MRFLPLLFGLLLPGCAESGSRITALPQATAGPMPREPVALPRFGDDGPQRRWIFAPTPSLLYGGGDRGGRAPHFPDTYSR